MNNSVTVIVPARLESTRLPAKVLADIAGTPMIIRVLQRAEAAQVGSVVAAVKGDVLQQAVRAAGFTAIETGDCDSGSARVAAAAAQLDLPAHSIIVNVQADEPFIEPSLIRDVALLLASRPDCCCASACRPIRYVGEYQDPTLVKVVTTKDDVALYFSRAMIPYQRDAQPDDFPTLARVHLGIYAYQLEYLLRWASLSPSPLETIEQLEQLRILWHGDRLVLLESDSASTGVDTADDLAQAYVRVASDETIA